VPLPVSAVTAAILMVLLIWKGSFNKVQYLFIAVGAVISGAYILSAFLAKPDWSTAAVNLVIPHLSVAPAYWLAVVGTVGTTITPGGQAFIQAYVVDKACGRTTCAARASTWLSARASPTSSRGSSSSPVPRLSGRPARRR